MTDPLDDADEWAEVTEPLDVWRKIWENAEREMEEMANEIERLRDVSSPVQAPVQNPSVVEHLRRALAELYPHACPSCGGRAYVGLSSVDCEARCGI